MKVFTFVLCLSLLMVTGVSFAQEPDSNEITLDAHFMVDFGTGVGDDGDSKFLGSAMWYPNYKDDGGVGVIAVGDDTGDGDQKIVVGPGVEFPMGPVYRATLNTILPEPWAQSFGNVVEAVRPYGRIGGLFDEDFDTVSPLVGTSMHIRPNKHIQIIPRADWINPQGRAKELFEKETWLFSVSAGFAF